MYNENYVIFKGTKDGVTVIFDPEVSFETLCTQLEKKVAEAGKFFDNVKTSLAFKGRVFTEEEEETLLKIIAKHTTMEITFVKTENNEIKRLSDLLEKELAPFNLAKFHKGSLRNGQNLKAASSWLGMSTPVQKSRQAAISSFWGSSRAWHTQAARA